MRILVAPDSFKGSGSAKNIGDIIKSAIVKEISHACVEVIPMADGGEGTIDALLHTCNGRKVNVTVTGPMGEKTNASYGILESSQTVVIEVAAVAGFTFVSEEARNPFKLTTYGVGECIIDALDKGYRRFIFCLGGSATNDGGLGMLQAIGVTFQDKAGNVFTPYPDTLEEIHSVDYSQIDPRIKKTEIQVASDVQNPLYGENGATYIFGPQKGVKPNQLELLDKKMKSFADTIEKYLDKEFHNLPGAGAAGGLGFALLTLGATIDSGAELIAENLELESKVARSDWIITGEGRTDYQTLQGKLPYVVAKLAKKHKVPALLISGSIDSDICSLYDVFDSMHAIANGPISLEESIRNTDKLLHHLTRNIARLLKHTG